MLVDHHCWWNQVNLLKRLEPNPKPNSHNPELITNAFIAIMVDDLGSRNLLLTIIEVGSLIIFNVLTLTGNTLVCISVYKNSRLRTTTNLYIIALAVSDLLSAVIVMPISTGVLLTGKWIFGGTICQLHAFFSLFVIYVSPVTMGLTAVNRYVRICKSDQQYRQLFSDKKSHALLACVWVFVACFTFIPRLAGLQTYEFVPGYAQCSIAHLSESGKMIHYGIVLTLFFLTPLIATTFSYIKVAGMIRQHNTTTSASIGGRNTPGKRLQRCGRSTSISTHEIKLSKSLFAVVFAFMICWVPFWIIVVLWRFRLVDRMPRNVELFCMFLLYLSNTINPFIYAGMNPAFRKEFRKILLCERLHKKVESSERRSKAEDVGTQSGVRRQKDNPVTSSGESFSANGTKHCQARQEKLQEMSVDDTSNNTNNLNYHNVIIFV